MNIGICQSSGKLQSWVGWHLDHLTTGRFESRIKNKTMNWELLRLIEISLGVFLSFMKRTCLFKASSLLLFFIWSITVFSVPILGGNGLFVSSTAGLLVSFFGVSFGALTVAYTFIGTTIRGIIPASDASKKTTKRSREIWNNFRGSYFFMNFTLISGVLLFATDVVLVALFGGNIPDFIIRGFILWPLLAFIVVLLLVVLGLSSFIRGMGKLRDVSQRSLKPEGQRKSW